MQLDTIMTIVGAIATPIMALLAWFLARLVSRNDNAHKVFFSEIGKLKEKVIDVKSTADDLKVMTSMEFKKTRTDLENHMKMNLKSINGNIERIYTKAEKIEALAEENKTDLKKYSDRLVDAEKTIIKVVEVVKTIRDAKFPKVNNE